MTPGALAWQPHPDTWLLATLLVGGYLYALSAWGPTHAPGGQAATMRQRVYFFLGVATMWAAADWPMDVLADQLFSVHMVQHMVFAFISAPLLILGMPGWLLRRMLGPRMVRWTWSFLTAPLVALVLFNGWTAGYHWPVLVNLSVNNDLFHLLVHVIWVGAGLIMWWPVLSPLPEMPHLSYPGSMAYLFGQSIVPTIPASFLTLGQSALYSTYAARTLEWGLDPITDQQIAGLLMKIGGGLLLWGVIAALFFRWTWEQETGGPDLRYWRDLEPSLRAARGAADNSSTEGGQ